MLIGRPLLNCSSTPIWLPLSSARTTEFVRVVDRRVDDVAGEVVADVERVRTEVAIEVARIGAALLPTAP